MVLTGSGYGDTLFESNRSFGNVSFYGYGGDDYIGLATGASGSRSSNAYYYGGPGDDFYFSEHRGDTIVEYANQGNDTLWMNEERSSGGTASSTQTYEAWYTPSNVENVIVDGSVYSMAGNDLNNVIVITSDKPEAVRQNSTDGDGIHDMLIYAGGGNDIIGSHISYSLIDGGAGTDTYRVSGLRSQYALSDVNGYVTIADQVSGRDGTDDLYNVERVYFIDRLTAIGSSVDDTLMAGDDVTEFWGGKGIDAVSYANTGSVDIDLSFPVGRGGAASGHIYDSIEMFIGSNSGDLMTGAGGSDKLLGGGGRDLIRGYGDSDLLGGGLGKDSIYGGDGDDGLDGGADDDVLYGDDGKDILVGDDGSDLLVGGRGDDTLMGGSDGDVIYGNEGDDLLGGGGGFDLLVGEDGDDGMDGGAGDDILYGYDGKDTLIGDQGEDLLLGGSGDDILSGGDDGDVLNGESGNDLLGGGNGADLLRGGYGNDGLDGGGGNDTLYGGEGNDTLDGDYGDDQLFGGGGADVFRFSVIDGGTDIIYDFTVGVDRISLLMGKSVSEALAGKTIIDGGSTIFDLGNDTKILILGAAGASEDWFLT